MADPNPFLKYLEAQTGANGDGSRGLAQPSATDPATLQLLTTNPLAPAAMLTAQLRNQRVAQEQQERGTAEQMLKNTLARRLQAEKDAADRERALINQSPELLDRLGIGAGQQALPFLAGVDTSYASARQDRQAAAENAATTAQSARGFESGANAALSFQRAGVSLDPAALAARGLLSQGEGTAVEPLDIRVANARASDRSSDPIVEVEQSSPDGKTKYKIKKRLSELTAAERSSLATGEQDARTDMLDSDTGQPLEFRNEAQRATFQKYFLGAQERGTLIGVVSDPNGVGFTFRAADGSTKQVTFDADGRQTIQTLTTQ